MPTRNDDLHGSAPDSSGAALLLIDVINALDFEGSEALLRESLATARKIAALKKRAREAAIPVLYANDNFGRWQSDLTKIVAHCRKEDMPGRPLTEMLAPEEHDYFVLKPKHSAFFSTTLDTLLRYLDVHTLILTGFAGNICVLFTANDAYMRDFRLFVPSDCTASNTGEENRQALELMARVLKADIRPSHELDLTALARQERSVAR